MRIPHCVHGIRTAEYKQPVHLLRTARNNKIAQADCFIPIVAS